MLVGRNATTLEVGWHEGKYLIYQTVLESIFIKLEEREVMYVYSTRLTPEAQLKLFPTPFLLTHLPPWCFGPRLTA